jgi:GDP-4-dehydro-6-deoxy-D-mannose reductase
VKKKHKAFITGIAGFAGSYLAEFLISRNQQVYGLVAPRESTINIRHIASDIELERYDLRNNDKLSASLKRIKPDYIYHLAAVSSVGQSFQNERFTYEINFIGSLNVFEAASKLKNRLIKVVFISSSEVYGECEFARRGLRESQAMNPISPYAISKAAGEYLALYYFTQNRVPVVRIRSFNHTGPRQSENFVVPYFCKQIALIEATRGRGRLLVGNLSVRRDLSDVRDIVAGYYLAALRGRPGDVYNLCSGQAASIKVVLDKLLRMSGAKIEVIADRTRFRKTDIPILLGDNRKAVRSLGWKPDYSLDRTLKDSLDYWRHRRQS